MHQFSGRGARVYLLGEQFAVSQVPLVDCGGGWNWCAGDGLHCWEGDGEFEVWEGEWDHIRPLEFFHRSGVVSFNRCLRGSHVRASGVCRPTSLIVESDTWKLEVNSVVRQAAVIGASEFTQRNTLGATAFLNGVCCGSEEMVFVLLAFNTGSFAGVGRMIGGLDSATIHFNDEGVLYEPARPERY